MKMVNKELILDGVEVKCVQRKYEYGSTALVILDAITGGIYTVATVNLDNIPEGYIAIKNYSENEGIYEWLIENNIIIESDLSMLTGFVECPLAKINEDIFV